MHAVRFDLKWRYWAATAVLLTVGVAGWPPGVAAAIGLALAQLAHFAWRERRLDTLTMQVRSLYLAVLLLGLAPPLALLHALATVGVWANVLLGYCLAARMLSLAPWNRRVPLSAKLVAWTFTAPPDARGILDRAASSFAADANAAGAAERARPGPSATGT